MVSWDQSAPPAVLLHASTLLFLAQKYMYQSRDPPTVPPVPPAFAGAWWLLKSWRGVKCSEAVCVAAWVIPPTSLYSCCPEGRQTPGQLVSLFLRQSHWVTAKNGAEIWIFCSLFHQFVHCFLIYFVTSCSYWLSPTATKRGSRWAVLIFVISAWFFSQLVGVCMCVCALKLICSVSSVIVCGLFDVSSCCVPLWCSQADFSLDFFHLFFLMQHPVKTVEGCSVSIMSSVFITHFHPPKCVLT